MHASLRNTGAAIRSVVVIGDALRPGQEGLPGGVDGQLIWLHDAIRRQVASASGLDCAPFCPTTDPAFAALIGRLWPAEQGLARWIATQGALPEPLETAIATRLCGCFCVGYELPAHWRALLGRLAVPFIDLRVHPVRFLDDLLFAALASDPATQAALVARSVPRSLIEQVAGLREAMLHYRRIRTLRADTLLVVGQRPLDGTQIVDGRLFDPETERARIEALCRSHANVLLKPHPSGETHALLRMVLEIRPDAEETTENCYRLLSQPEIAGVLTVNSSLAYEAPWFGRMVHALAPLPIEIGWRGEAVPGTYASLGDEVLSVDFWRMVLRPFVAVSEEDGVRLPAKANRLRLALDSFWHFEQVDTELVPREGRAAAVG